MRSVMPPEQLAQVAMPVSRIGPVTTLGGIALGFFALSIAWTESNVASSMIGSTATATCSASGFASRVFQTLRLKRCIPLVTRKGLFGEVMAGLVTESYTLVGEHDWCVPIFLFRHHEDARNYLFSLVRNPARTRPPTGKLDQETQAALADLIALSKSLAEIEKRTGRKAPTVIT